LQRPHDFVCKHQLVLVIIMTRRFCSLRTFFILDSGKKSFVFDFLCKAIHLLFLLPLPQGTKEFQMNLALNSYLTVIGYLTGFQR
jgi:hypothetical protein